MQGYYSESEPLYLQALVIRKKILGNDNLVVASTLNALAGLYEKQGRSKEAESFCLESLALRKKFLGDHHTDVAQSYWWLGVLFSKMQEYRKAKTLYFLALEIFEETLGKNHPRTRNLIDFLNDIPEHIEPIPLEELGL